MPRRVGKHKFYLEARFVKDEGTVSLSVQDYTSSTALLEIEVSAAEWLGLTSGSVLRVEGFITPHLDRIGRVMKHRTLDVPREVTDGLRYGTDERKVAVKKWGDAQAVAGEEVETRNSNTGWKVIFRSYEGAEK